MPRSPKRKNTQHHRNGSLQATSGQQTTVEQSEHTYLSAIIESSSDAIISMAFDTTITSWNKTAEKLYGYTGEEAIGKKISIITPRARRAGLREAIRRIKKGEHITQFETERIAKDGTRITVSVTVSPIFNNTGAIIGIASIGHNISEEQRNRELLKLHSTVYETISDAVIVTTPDRRIVSWNKAAEKISGYTAREMASKKHPLEFLETKYTGATPESVRESLLTKGSWVGEATHRVKGKKLIHTLLTISPIMSSTNEFLGAVTIARDITERIAIGRELEILHERLELAQSVGHVGIFEYNFKTNTTWRNREQERLFGIENHPRRFVQSKMEEFVHPEDRNRVMDLFNTVIKTKGTNIDLEYRIVHPDMSVHWLSSSGWLTYDTHAEPERYLGINLDIDKRKEVERMLEFKAEATKLLAQSLDYTETLNAIGSLAVPAIADWYAVYMLEGENVTLAALHHKDPKKIKWGYELAKKFPIDMRADEGVPNVIKKGVTDFWPYIPFNFFENHPKIKEQPKLLEIIKKIGYTGAVTVPLRSRKKSIGAISFVTAESKRTMTDLDRQIVEELAAQASAAIERARLYKEVEDKQKHMINLVSDIPAVIWEAYMPPDPEKERINFMNNYITVLTGHTPQDWYDDTEHFYMKLLHPDDRARSRGNFMRAFKEGRDMSQRVRWVGKDRRIIPVEMQQHIIKDPSGKPIGVRGLAIDITEQVEQERRKDEFISMASHELKTPITSIKLFTEILQRAYRDKKPAHRRTSNDDSSEHLKFLANINEQVDKLTHLVSDLLDVSRITAGKLELSREIFPLDALIEKTVETIQLMCPQQRIVCAQSSPIYVYADRERLSQIMINLLINASKYSPKSDRIDVSIAQKGAEAIVAVRDYGIGIAPEHQHKIFKRFYRVYDTTDRTFPGLGMGLYISSEIAKKNGGRMWVESKLGKGSTFFFSVPIAEKPAK